MQSIIFMCVHTARSDMFCTIYMYTTQSCDGDIIVTIVFNIATSYIPDFL